MKKRTLRIEETSKITLDGLLLGYGAVAPYPAAALALAFAPPEYGVSALNAAIVWGGAILLFLGGVRRGLSFRTEGGPSVLQIAGALGLYGVGLAALTLPTKQALAMLLLGHLWMLARDPVAARLGDVPLYFAHLRPPQMSIAVVSLAALLGLSLPL